MLMLHFMIYACLAKCGQKPSHKLGINALYVVYTHVQHITILRHIIRYTNELESNNFRWK